jgi:hypothetical protein
VVNGTTYAKGRQPSFIVTAAPGMTVDMILSTKVNGSKVVGIAAESPAGSTTFRLPRSIKLGTYTITAQASGLNSNVLSFKVVSRIPKPKRTLKPKPKATHKASIPVVKAVIRVKLNVVQAHQVHTTSTSNGHMIDQAVNALVQNPLLFENKKRQ